MQIHELNTFSGTLGSSTYFAVDNGTDTGKVSAKQLCSETDTAVKNINNSIKNIVALEITTPSFTMQTGKVISSAGTISSTSGTAYKVTDYIPVEGGQVVTCKYSRARWGNQNWAFYDADKAVVSTYGKTASATTVEYCNKIVVPLGAKYFVAARDENSISNEPNTDVVIITKYCESIDQTPKSAVLTFSNNSMVEESYTLTQTASKLIGSSGLITNTTSADYLVVECSVSTGDVINIRNCQARYSNKMYAFYDASGLPISVKERADNNPNDFMMLEVPFGATRLAVSGYSTYPTVTKVTHFSGDAAAFKWSGKKWAAMGDSITDANNSRATKRYFNYISDATGISVTNLGLSGTGYMKAYNDNLPFYQRVDTIPLDSDVITIFGSGNDCSLTLGNVTDTGTTTVCGCINNTIDGIRARIVGANIGIISPTPWDDYPTYTDNNMSRYCEALEQICNLKGVPFLNLYRCSNMLPWEQSFREAFYTHDDGNGVHPDENGHKFFAPHIKAFLETLLM